MPNIKTDRLFSAEYLVGVAVALALAYSTYTAWKADTAARLIALEAKATAYQEDHDTLVGMKADVQAMKESLSKIEGAVLFKKDAANVH